MTIRLTLTYDDFQRNKYPLLDQLNFKIINQEERQSMIDENGDIHLVKEE